MKTPSISRRILGGFACWTIVFACWTMAMPATAWGVPVTFRFSGEATEIDDSGGSIGDAITVGSPVVGSFVFESTVSDRDP
ncbi:MAG: hypothetical protein ACC645_28050, partial [Pirellulales bacterium]